MRFVPCVRDGQCEFIVVQSVALTCQFLPARTFEGEQESSTSSSFSPLIISPFFSFSTHVQASELFVLFGKMSVPSSSNKRNRVFNSSSSNNDSSDACGEDDKGKDFGDEEHHARMSKKPRGEEEEELQQQQQHQQQQENNVDSDSDYDDMLDDFAVPTDMDDYLDDEEVDDDDDDLSTTSTRTTMSTGSVGSNTPSVVGENLESFSLVEAGEKMAGGKNKEQQQLQVGGPVVKNTEPPLRRSLFPHVPPSINFVHHNEVPETPLPAELRKNLRWKLSNITPAVVKKVVTNSGFRLMRKSCSEWGGTWGKHMKSHLFKESISESQKINHFPGTFNIGRKDRLWKNYHKMRLKYGKEEFSFLPRTFCLPADAKLLRRVWEKRGIKAKWIIKPPAVRFRSRCCICSRLR